jgi:hypothetical protein
MPRKAKAKSRPGVGNGGARNGRSRRRNGNGGASVLQSIQPLMRTTANYRPMNNKVHQMSGSDFLSTVTVVPNITDPDDRILSVISVSPSLFTGTRLAVMSQLFERYRFVSFRVRYVPAVPTTLGCQLLSYLDTDPLTLQLSLMEISFFVRRRLTLGLNSGTLILLRLFLYP